MAYSYSYTLYMNSMQPEWSLAEDLR